ncbi:MAG: enoyl-CoA hydratase/isomerase family protein [Myxococcales bacterium]|nr:enoyl-CoA hydratase/isomerase family protein [Myxococcales bacterium]
MPESIVLLEKKGAIALLTINRPDKLNALNLSVLEALGRRLDEIEADDSIRVVVLTGAGRKAFVAGADIAELAPLDYHGALKFSVTGNACLGRIETSSKPFIAAVNGFALGGGCELALVCDVILAANTARFGFPEVSIGVIPGFGGTQRLARLIGRNAAKHWTMTGDIYPADEAQRIGLVYRLHDPDELMDAAFKTANKMARRAPLAVAECKNIINRGTQLPLEYALDAESRAFATLFQTDDQTEGMSAFMAKRKPEFTGK